RELRSWVEDPGQKTGPGAWTQPILLTEAARGRGVPELIDQVQSHREWLASSGEWNSRQRLFIESEMGEILRERLEEKLLTYFESQDWGRILAQVSERKLAPLQVSEDIS